MKWISKKTMLMVYVVVVMILGSFGQSFAGTFSDDKVVSLIETMLKVAKGLYFDVNVIEEGSDKEICVNITPVDFSMMNPEKLGKISALTLILACETAKNGNGFDAVSVNAKGLINAKLKMTDYEYLINNGGSTPEILKRIDFKVE